MIMRAAPCLISWMTTRRQLSNNFFNSSFLLIFFVFFKKKSFFRLSTRIRDPERMTFAAEDMVDPLSGLVMRRSNKAKRVTDPALSPDHFAFVNSWNQENRRCGECGKLFTNAKVNIVHQVSSHGFLNTILCVICRESFVGKSAFNRHMSLHHPDFSRDVSKLCCSKWGFKALGE